MEGFDSEQESQYKFHFRQLWTFLSKKTYDLQIEVGMNVRFDIGKTYVDSQGFIEAFYFAKSSKSSPTFFSGFGQL